MKTLLQITNNVYWMPFPKQENIVEISAFLNKEFGHQYYIWNLSEHDYRRELFQNQVSMHSYVGFACPPLYELLLICKCILEWVSHESNVAIVHCQQNKGRSAILLSLFWTFVFKTKIQESFYIISKTLNVQTPLKCQLIYLKNYIQHLFSKNELNDQPIRVKSIILSSGPKQFDKFQPYFQILDRNGILYEEKNQIINKNEQCIFILPNFLISQDIVFRCKHITQDGDLIPVFRFQIHTGFLFKNVLRITSSNLDLSVNFPHDFYIDLVYLRGNDNKNIPDFQKTNQDQVAIEGNILINKLLQSCQDLSQQTELTLYQENTIPQLETRSIIQEEIQQQQQQQQQLQQIVQIAQQRKQSNQETNAEKNKHQEIQSVEMTEMHMNESEKIVEKNKNDDQEENDDDDEIII